jgi:hypothetical protein
MAVVLENRVAAGVAPAAQFPQQHHAVGHPGRQPFVDVRGKRVEARAPFRARFCLGHPRRPQLRPHRVPGDAQLGGDLPDRPPVPVQFVAPFHESTSSHLAAPSLPARRLKRRSRLFDGGSIPTRRSWVNLHPAITPSHPTASGATAPFTSSDTGREFLAAGSRVIGRRQAGPWGGADVRRQDALGTPAKPDPEFATSISSAGEPASRGGASICFGC